MKTKDYLEQAICSFVDDPADSDYQRGYLAAMIEVMRQFHPEFRIEHEIELQTIKQDIKWSRNDLR